MNKTKPFYRFFNRSVAFNIQINKLTKYYKMRAHWIIMLLVFAAISSCSNDDTIELHNPTELQQYLERFLEEARELGVDYDVSKLQLRFISERIQDKYCGYGYSNYNYSGYQLIQIANIPSCWADRSDTEKEALFFHEVGHALLNRQHTEQELPNGLFKSMMCGECNQFGIYNDHKSHRREYYVKELILEDTETPDWGKIKENFQPYYSKDIVTDNQWLFSSQDNNISGEVVGSNNDFPNGALKIGSPSIQSTNSGFWRIRLENPNIPTGATVKLEVKLKTLNNLDGPGINVIFRMDKLVDGVYQAFDYRTTYPDLPISGEVDESVNLTIPDFLSGTSAISVFILFQDKTLGEIYIEDVDISYAVD